MAATKQRFTKGWKQAPRASMARKEISAAFEGSDARH